MLRVVVINGGRGAATIIPALLSRQGVHVTSIVNAYDDGKSTGEIRRFFRMLGPSDIRKVQELMLPQDDPDFPANTMVFGYRFPKGTPHFDAIDRLKAFATKNDADLVGARFANRKVRQALQAFTREFLDGLKLIEKVHNSRFDFSDCSIMNCIYAGAFLAFNRNIEDATLFIDRLFKLRGTVLPTSLENKQLVALRDNGQVLYSEADIVSLRSNARIDRIYLLDGPLDEQRFELLSQEEKRHYLDMHHCCVTVLPRVRFALQQADIIVYAAGTQHSSLYPTYLAQGLAESIADNRSASKVFVTNIGADYETPMYSASDYIRGAYRYLNLSGGRVYRMDDLFDVVLINRTGIQSVDNYVEYDEQGFSDIPAKRVIGSFESLDSPGKHDGVAVVRAIIDLYESKSALA